MQLQSFPVLQSIQSLSKTTTWASFPIGIHLPGCIGRFATNKPIAFLFKAAAICNGPVLAATSPLAAFIKAIYLNIK